jgi:hypothetical protein
MNWMDFEDRVEQKSPGITVRRRTCILNPLTPDGDSPATLKVADGLVHEVGIADPTLTRTLAVQVRLMSNFDDD